MEAVNELGGNRGRGAVHCAHAGTFQVPAIAAVTRLAAWRAYALRIALEAHQNRLAAYRATQTAAARV